MNKAVSPAQKLFTQKLREHKQLLDNDISVYTDTIRQSTIKNYGQQSLVAVDPYCAILDAGGKRIRGVLTLVGYEMMGGTDKAMIIEAARALEMMHAYILVIDDIQDKAELRRGIPVAHRAAAIAHDKLRLRGDADHFGVSMALNGALIGSHAANVILANLSVDESLRIKALSIMNHTMMVTAQGQTNDILNEVTTEPVTEQKIDNVMLWKTAHYTILNPIHVGMVLAGAPCEDTNAITQYALNVGKAFQLTDDLLIMSSDEAAGKAVSDDIREGKQTMLTAHVFKHGSDTDKKFLQSLLGNENNSQSDIDACRELFIKTGAVDYARNRAQDHIAEALASLDLHKDRWTPDSVDFLRGLTDYIMSRTH